MAWTEPRLGRIEKGKIIDLGPAPTGPTNLTDFLTACFNDHQAAIEELRAHEGEASALLLQTLNRDLARIAADRKILELHGPNEWGLCNVCVMGSDEERNPCTTVRLLASPYKGREGWQEAWV